jgi:hypothetical protein
MFSPVTHGQNDIEQVNTHIWTHDTDNKAVVSNGAASAKLAIYMRSPLAILQSSHSHIHPATLSPLTFAGLSVLHVLDISLVHRLRSVRVIPNTTPLLPNHDAGFSNEPGGARLRNAVESVLELVRRVDVEVADTHLAGGGGGHV